MSSTSTTWTTDTNTKSGAVQVSTSGVGTFLEIRGSTGTAFTGAGKLTLSTAETTVTTGDVLGVISFQAPEDSEGTDSILPSAAIWAIAEDSFDADENESSLVFATAVSETALQTGNERMRITAAGKVGIGLTPTANMVGLSIEAGVITLRETGTPTADTNYGKIYTKSDNKLYFQDGAGTEYTVDITAV